VYHGVWGAAPFQRLYHQPTGSAESLLAMPEWWLVVAALGWFSLLGLAWAPMLLVLPLFIIALLAAVGQSTMDGLRAPLARRGLPHRRRVALRGVTVALHLLQPIARLVGRLRAGLNPWRQIGRGAWALPIRRSSAHWTEQGRDPDDWVRATEVAGAASGAVVGHGGAFDRWDLEVHAAPPASARVLVAVEDHGGGQQLVRFRVSPRVRLVSVLTIVVLAGLGAAAAADGATIAALLLMGSAAVGGARTACSCALATGIAGEAFRSVTGEGDHDRDR